MDQRPDPRLDQRPHVTQQTTTSGATWGIAVLLIVVIAAGAFFVFGGGADTDSPMTPATESTTPAEPAAPPATDAAPAALAGFYATYGIVSHTMPTETWQLVFSIIGAAAVGITAFVRVTALATPEASGQGIATA